jgi:hypothetical protein
MAKRPLTSRAARREAARQAQKDARDRERLFLLEPGGTPDRPIDVGSASEVEVVAVARRCPRCGSRLRVEEHLAETIGKSRLRTARVLCATCGARYALYFRLGGPLPN